MTTTLGYRLRPGDLARVASIGLRSRRLRATLSALGIAIGVAAMVAVLGLSASSQAGLLAEIDRLGTNLLTVSTGTTLTGEAAELPLNTPRMVARIGPVTQVDSTGTVNNIHVYRSPYIPAIDTNGLAVKAASLNLPATVAATIAHGRFLNAATATQPVAVLGWDAAIRLGVDQVHTNERIWVGSHWFYIAGILHRAELAPEIDTSVLIGYPTAQRYLGFDGHPSTVYVRADPNQVNAVHDVLAATANPENPGQVSVSRPSAALQARAAAQSALSSLFLGLGAVALLVGGIGVANTMVISVLERRSEIGLRRSLGATKGHIRVQFLAEAILLSTLGGTVGVIAGGIATGIYASARHWQIVVPPLAWGGGLAAAVAIGAIAGLLPAIRAARMPPTEALRTT